MKKYVDVLGTRYHIISVKSGEIPEGYGGFCDPDLRTIKILQLKTLEEWKDESETKILLREKEFLRHEIVHAFLNESGLKDNCFNIVSAWANNEEMVDWFAIQGPKIYEAWKKSEAL